MFLPAFSFTLIGHPLFEKLTNIDWVGDLLDGITASVVGLVFVTACELARDTVSDPTLALIYGLTIGALYVFKHPLTSIGCVLAAGVAGQALYNF